MYIEWIGIALAVLGMVGECALSFSPYGVGMTLAGACLLFWKRRDSRSLRTPLDGSASLFLIVVGFSPLVTVFPEVTLTHVYCLVSAVVGCYALIWWGCNRERLFLLAIGFVVGSILLSLIAPFIVAWNLSKDFLIPSRIYGIFPLVLSDPVHPNILASLMVLLNPVLFSLWLGVQQRPSRKPYTTVLGAGWVLTAVVLFLTSSRGGYLAWGAGILLALLFWKRRKLAFALAVVVGCVLVWFLSAGGQPEVLPGAVAEALNPESWAFRQQVWGVALQMMADFPFTGVGGGNFNTVALLLYPFSETANPGTHNLYLQVGVDFGLPGLIAYLSILGGVLWMAGTSIWLLQRSVDKELLGFVVGLSSGLAALLIHGLVDNTMWGSRAAFIPWIVIGAIVAVCRFAVTLPISEAV